MKEFGRHLSPQEQRLQQRVLAAAAREGIGPWDSCVVGQAARPWPLMVVIEMNLRRLRKGFSPLPVRSSDGTEFFAPWSYAAVGVRTRKELATLFETIAERLEKLSGDDDSLGSEERDGFCSEDVVDGFEAEEEEQDSFDDCDGNVEFSGFGLEDIELDADGNHLFLLEPAEPDFDFHSRGGRKEGEMDDRISEILKTLSEKLEMPETCGEAPADQGDGQERGLFEEDEDYCFDEGLDELTASAKADAELDRFNLILDAQLSWIRNYPDAEQRVEFYKWLREFLAKAADRLDELY